MTTMERTQFGKRRLFNNASEMSICLWVVMSSYENKSCRVPLVLVTHNCLKKIPKEGPHLSWVQTGKHAFPISFKPIQQMPYCGSPVRFCWSPWELQQASILWSPLWRTFLVLVGLIMLGVHFLGVFQRWRLVCEKIWMW